MYSHSSVYVGEQFHLSNIESISATVRCSAVEYAQTHYS